MYESTWLALWRFRILWASLLRHWKSWLTVQSRASLASKFHMLLHCTRIYIYTYIIVYIHVYYICGHIYILYICIHIYLHVKCVKCVFCARRWDMTAVKSTTLSLSQQVLHHILSLIQEPLCLRSEFLGNLKPCKLPEGVFLTPWRHCPAHRFFLQPLKRKTETTETDDIPGSFNLWKSCIRSQRSTWGLIPNNKNKTPGKLDELFYNRWAQMLRYILGKQLGNIQMIAEKASREATLSCGVHVFGPVAEQMSLGLALPWLWLFLHCLNCWKLRLK